MIERTINHNLINQDHNVKVFSVHVLKTLAKVSFQISVTESGILKFHSNEPIFLNAVPQISFKLLALEKSK